MKKFIIHVLRFGAVVLGFLCIIELLVPRAMITHRSWEAERVYGRDLFPGPFYPNRSLTRDEVGDLAHHTDRAVVKKNIHWTTDELGFRNGHFNPSPDIFFLGQSMIAGSSVSQEQTLPSQTATLSGRTTMNLAPISFSQFVKLYEAGIIEKPEFVVYGRVERHLPKLKPIKTSSANQGLIKLQCHPLYLKLATALDRILSRRSQHYLKARLNSRVGGGLPSPVKPGMIFLEEESIVQAGWPDVRRHADIISSYRDYCESIGCKFIFIPIPNRKTVYFDLVPLDKQPNYLRMLNIALDNRGIMTINTLELFNRHRDTLLYHLDDTHWNATGIEIVANELVELIDRIE